ncbi:MAG: hypothetical protein K0R94_859 [Burkholderiales bacterium]|nr:hypothetical protein [Burkholderiales bacterium]
MKKFKVNGYFISFCILLLLGFREVTADILQKGEFYFTTTPNIAHVLDPSNEDGVFRVRWALDNGGLSGQLRIATSLNSTETYIMPSAMTGLSSGGVLHIEESKRGRNGVLYKINVTYGVPNSFTLDLAMPGTNQYFRATRTAGIIFKRGQVDYTAYPNPETFEIAKDNYTQKILAKKQALPKETETSELITPRHQVNNTETKRD